MGGNYCCCGRIVAQEGRTVLHIAAERGNEDLCRKFIEAEASLDIIDQVGLVMSFLFFSIL